MKQIGVTAVAKNIPIEIENRFKYYLKKSISLTSDLNLECYIPNKDSETLHSSGLFSSSISKNSGIRKLINESNCEVIACADIDVVIPPGLLDYVYYKSIQTQCNIFVVCRYVNIDNFDNNLNWDEFYKFPLEYRGLGGLNCMTTDLWIKSGGWPEELYGWGYEDDFFRQKLESRNIETINIISFPLLHINHPVRNINQMYSHLNNVRISKHQDLYSTNWL